MITCVLKMVRDAPAADVEPVRNGRWEECDWVDVDEHGFGTRRTFKAGLRCSQCACVFKKELLWKRNWCPNCGAKMEGGAERCSAEAYSVCPFASHCAPRAEATFMEGSDCDAFNQRIDDAIEKIMRSEDDSDFTGGSKP